jgi:hypothetical protein
MILYIIIILIIIYFINKVNYNCTVSYWADYRDRLYNDGCTIKESFTDNVNNLCNIVKDNFKTVLGKTAEKCIKDEKKESKQQINDGIDCYNFTGNEIVSKNNVSSWCDLNSVDIDIINKAIEKIK